MRPISLILKAATTGTRGHAEGLQEGIEYFEQAIEKDPAYALAYSGLADCYARSGSASGSLLREAFPKAKAAAERPWRLTTRLPKLTPR